MTCAHDACCPANSAHAHQRPRVAAIILPAGLGKPKPSEDQVTYPKPLGCRAQPQVDWPPGVGAPSGPALQGALCPDLQSQGQLPDFRSCLWRWLHNCTQPSKVKRVNFTKCRRRLHKNGKNTSHICPEFDGHCPCVCCSLRAFEWHSFAAPW